MTATIAQQLIAYLWPNGDPPTAPQVYALLDGARDPRIEPMIRLSQLEYSCLYAGRLAPALQAAAPYLVHLTPNARFTSEFLDRGWGQSWGILTVVPPDVPLQQQRRHFRTLLRVRDADGKILVFRFYDPRVLRTYLPTCTASETAQMFGPIPCIVVESPDPRRVIVYRVGDGGVAAETIALQPSGPEASN